MSQKVTPFLWIEGHAEAAANLYVSLVPNSQIDSVKKLPGPADDVVTIVHFTLAGVSYIAMDAKGGIVPSEYFSLSVTCDDQAEVDKLWNTLVDGGEEIMCGWLKDRFGMRWQIVPKRFNELIESGNPAQVGAVMQAMMGMVKFDVAGLEAAYNGAS